MAITGQRNLKRYLPWIIGGTAAVFLGLLAAVALLFYLFSGKVVVSDLKLSQNKVTLGQPLTATLKLENQSRIGRTYHLALLVDGAETASQDVKLNGSETRDIPIDLPGLPLGNHEIKAEEITQQIRILTPAAFKIVNLTADPQTAISGDTIELIATVMNTGETAGTFTSDATVDASSLPICSIQLDPGATNDMEIPISNASAGLHTAQMGTSSAVFHVVRPAEISISDVSASSASVPVNKDVEVQVTLKNEGDIDGTFPLIPWIDGDAQLTQNVTVKGQQTASEPLSYRFDKAGAHRIEIGGTVLTINVVEVTRPDTGALLLKKANGGSGKLTLVNNYDVDALFLLANEKDPQTPVMIVYVRGKSTTKTIRIKDGTYIVYYSLGSDFDKVSKRFITNASYSRFDDTIDYSTKSDYDYIYYSTWKITLNNGDGSNAPTKAVPEDQFPK